MKYLVMIWTKLLTIIIINYRLHHHQRYHYNSHHQFQDPHDGEEEVDWIKTWSEEQTRRRERIEKVAIYLYL